MPDLWMPGLRHDPGRSAGYPGGHVKMQWFKHHDTAGTNSYEICKWGRAGYNVGLCTILLPKVGTPWQFCEFDSFCADSGVWNGYGASAEVERLGHQEELTPDQIHWLREIGSFAESWGIPNVPYRGPQFGATGFTGHVNHSDIAFNPDGLTPEEWDAINAAPTPPPPKGDPVKMVQYGDTWIQFGVDTAGDLIQSTYDANLVLVKGAQDVRILGDNRPSSDVTVDVLGDKRILVGSEDRNGKNRAISYRPGDGWYDAAGKKL